MAESILMETDRDRDGDGGEKEKREERDAAAAVVAQEDQDEEILKKRISRHPLFRLLIENHLNCLKVYLSISSHQLFCSSFFLVKLVQCQEEVSVSDYGMLHPLELY